MKWDPMKTHDEQHLRNLFRRMVIQSIEAVEEKITEEIVADFTPKSLPKCKQEIAKIFKEIYKAQNRKIA